MNAREPAVLPTASRPPTGPDAAAPREHAAPFAALAGKWHYRLGALLGEGGNGVVFRAICDETGQDVAIKLMRDDAALSAAERAHRRARFRRETSLCEALRHSNIVALLDQGKRPTGACSRYSNWCRAGPCATGSRRKGRCRPSTRGG